MIPLTSLFRHAAAFTSQVGLILCATTPIWGADEVARNVIVLVTDDQGYGDLGCHGNPVIRTPHLDRLHNESVRFTQFHVAPMCTPTRGQLMTGVDALRNGAMNVSSGRTLLRREFATLPELLRQAGLTTGIFGKWHLGDNYPFRPEDRGFDETVWFPSSHIGSVPDQWNNAYFDDTYIRNGQRQHFTGYTTDVLFREAMAWMKKQHAAGKRFFCYLPTAAPHSPLYVPAKYREAVGARLDAARPKLPPLSPQQADALVRFLAMIENIDENLGRLEGFLRSEDLRDNTLLLFLTDNGSTMGDAYFNAGMKGRKTTLWEGGHRVPLFVRWPAGKIRRAEDETTLTQVQDLLPTILELCGAAALVPQRIDGVSLAPLLRDSTTALVDRMLFINYSRMPGSARVASATSPSIPRMEGSAVLWKNWRLLENRTLYDVARDPLQDHDVALQHPEVVSRMRAQLNSWWEGLKDRVNEPQRVVIGAAAENLTMLTACEWWDVFVDRQFQVRRGDAKNGVWHIAVAAAGDYQIELRRWPRESGLALTAAAPAATVADGALPAGRALPIASARIEVQGQMQRASVASAQGGVVFRVPLRAGPTTLQTWFYDANDEALCGAYYAYLTKL